MDALCDSSKENRFANGSDVPDAIHVALRPIVAPAQDRDDRSETAMIAGGIRDVYAECLSH